MAALNEMMWPCPESLAMLHTLTQKALPWSTYELVLVPNLMQ